MLCFLTFGITLLPGKYLFPTSGELVSTSWEISIFTFYQVNTLFPLPGKSQLVTYTRYLPFSTSGELHISTSGEQTCDLVNNRF